MLQQRDIENTLQQYLDPYLAKDLISSGIVKNISLANNQIQLDIVLGYPAKRYQHELRNTLETMLKQLSGKPGVTINVSWDIAAHTGQPHLKPLSNIKNIIAVASGKGGVGKSTTAVNIALALAGEGAQVGILDADIYGPSQPLMLGVSQERPTSKDGKLMQPITSHGLQSMSIGYLIDKTQPTIWRGPMVSGALLQLLNDTHWDDLDYLIIDLPPGTGDIQLTLSQKIPVSGAVIVTTPQDIALSDARKGLQMFRKVKVPVLGIVENMSLHTCSECGHQEPIFGSGGGRRIAEELNTDLLGQLPLDSNIRKQADGGNPTVVAEPESDIALNYYEIARKIAAKLSLQSRDYTSIFPNIEVENN